MAIVRRAVFLDKDGTLVRDVPFNDDPDKVELMPGVAEGLRRLAREGYLLIMVTNQSGLARGLMTEHGLRRSLARLDHLLFAQGVRLDAAYICPHHPDGSVEHLRIACDCRKPSPGSVLRAAREHGIDLAASWLIGDILDDVEAGNRAGCRTVMVRGGETEWLRGPYRSPTALVTGFEGAVRTLLEADAVRTSRRVAL